MTSKRLAALNRKALIIKTARDHPDWLHQRIAEVVGGCGRKYVSHVLRSAQDYNIGTPPK